MSRHPLNRSYTNELIGHVEKFNSDTCPKILHIQRTVPRAN
jgi:hypothetical protein